MKSAWDCFYKAVVNTVNHDGIEHAGYLAFLGLLALFPFLVFVFAVIGVIGAGEAGAGFITQALQALPGDIAAGLQPRVTEIVSGPPQGLLTVSILGAIWTASSAVEGMRTVLNRAYHVATPPAYWFRRSLSILQLLLFTFIVVIGMVILVAIPLALEHLETTLNLHITAAAGERISQMAYLIIVAVLFAAVSYLYYLIPNIKQRFVSVAPGALVVVALWLCAAHLFSLYLANFDQVNLIYGSLGSIIAALIFFYICNIIFIFGAELNYQIVYLIGMRIIERETVLSDGDTTNALD